MTEAGARGIRIEDPGDVESGGIAPSLTHNGSIPVAARFNRMLPPTPLSTTIEISKTCTLYGVKALIGSPGDDLIGSLRQASGFEIEGALR
jgi:hypothetical protein